MSSPTENVPAVENEKDQKTLDAAISEIDQQKEKVEKAETPAQEAKEEKKLDLLLEKFDQLLERMAKVEEKTSEPVVPAPTVKDTPPTEETKATEEPAKPAKRRLGAWG